LRGWPRPILRHRQPKEIVMTNVVPMSRPLRLALLADAAASGVTAALLVAGADFLESLLVLPVALIRGAGMVLTPYVILVIFVASRPATRVNTVNAIIGINAAWTAASALLLVSGLVVPSALGMTFVLAQGLAVGAFGVIQYVCLRHAPGAVAA